MFFQNRVTASVYTFLISLNLLLPSLILWPDGNHSANPDKLALQTSLKSIEDQIRTLREEIDQLHTKKESFRDQIASIHTQKRIDDINSRLQDLSLKISAEQKKNNISKLVELTNRQSVIQKELPIQQDLLNLYLQLQIADSNMQNEYVKSLNEQIKAKHNEIKALFQHRPALAISTNSTSSAAKPAFIPKPEDSTIQTILDQLKVLDDKINQGLLKMDSLQNKRSVLKNQLKAMGK